MENSFQLSKVLDLYIRNLIVNQCALGLTPEERWRDYDETLEKFYEEMDHDGEPSEYEAEFLKELAEQNRSLEDE